MKLIEEFTNAPSEMKIAIVSAGVAVFNILIVFFMGIMYGLFGIAVGAHPFVLGIMLVVIAAICAIVSLIASDA